MPRRICGIWSPGLIWLHNASDFLIWTAYIAIPIVLATFALKKKRGELPFTQLFWLFGLFIIACGTTHLMDIVMFYWPIYRFAGLVKLVTAAASWGTVLALVRVVPAALSMKSPEVLQLEIEEREKAEAQVRQLNSELEDRVLERTAALEAANHTKDNLLASEQKVRLEAEEARAEAEIARETAETANRAKDEFLMTLSHELRTPLNAIQGWSALLRSGQLDAETSAQALETIERNAWTQAQLIADILEVSRIITGKMVLELNPLDPAPIVEAALAAVQPAATAKGIEIQSRLEAGGGVVSGDGPRLQQVVWNLLSNAIKFTPRGGHVKIEMQREESALEIRVSDTGEGIAPEFLPHVFDRFRQADSSNTRVHGGLGLGLAIVRHLVELHGGTVRAHSAGLGKGATFTVLLPLRAVATRSAPANLHLPLSPAPPPSPPHSLQGLQILVVDDEIEARTLISTILILHGAQTRTAASANEALEILSAWQPDFLVSDIGMPDQNGYQLIEKVRRTKTGSQIPALALTAYASADDRTRALAAGFGAHLSKPVEPGNLVAEVARLSGRLGDPAAV